MQNFSNIKSYILAHKAVSAVALVIILGGGWLVWGRGTSASAQTHYLVGAVGRGTVVASVSASGQIAATNQVDLKPKASGAVVGVYVKPGQSVRAGQVLVQLDPGSAGYELTSAQLSYQKLVSVDSQTLIDDQGAVTQAQDDQTAAYTTARAALTKAATDLESNLEGVGNFYNGGYLNTQNGLSDAVRQLRSQAQSAWYTAKSQVTAYQASLRAMPANASNAQVDALVAQAYTSASAEALAAKDTQDTIVLARTQDDTAPADLAYTSITSLTSSANSIVSSLSSAQSTTVSAGRTLQKAQAALEQLQSGPDEIDRRSSALAVQQKQEALADYSVAAPFAGTVATVAAQVGDEGSSGTAVATLITPSQVADISLNEVDVAKVKVGQKATLTFDAIDNLTLTGTVAAVDGVGTVSQGVVSYGVQIALDAQDSRIKPGMTVNAQIQTDTAQDVLVVPASAVKTSSGQSYVLEFSPPLASSTVSAAGAQGVVSATAPVQVPVVAGISDDSSVEIISGLSEGEQIVTRTISASSATTATASRTAAGGTAARGGLGGGAALRAF